MPNREKVIRALENCTARDKCLDCPWESCEYDSPTLRIPLDLAQEALELLKAQEPVEPIEYDPVIYQFRYICGSCRHRIWRENNFCPNCGKAVKWEWKWE